MQQTRRLIEPSLESSTQSPPAALPQTWTRSFGHTPQCSAHCSWKATRTAALPNDDQCKTWTPADTWRPQRTRQGIAQYVHGPVCQHHILQEHHSHNTARKRMKWVPAQSSWYEVKSHRCKLCHGEAGSKFGSMLSRHLRCSQPAHQAVRTRDAGGTKMAASRTWQVGSCPAGPGPAQPPAWAPPAACAPGPLPHRPQAWPRSAPAPAASGAPSHAAPSEGRTGACMRPWGRRHSTGANLLQDALQCAGPLLIQAGDAVQG